LQGIGCRVQGAGCGVGGLGVGYLSLDDELAQRGGYLPSATLVTYFVACEVAKLVCLLVD